MPSLQRGVVFFFCKKHSKSMECWMFLYGFRYIFSKYNLLCSRMDNGSRFRIRALNAPEVQDSAENVSNYFNLFQTENSSLFSHFLNGVLYVYVKTCFDRKYQLDVFILIEVYPRLPLYQQFMLLLAIIPAVLVTFVMIFLNNFVMVVRKDLLSVDACYNQGCKKIFLL